MPDPGYETLADEWHGVLEARMTYYKITAEFLPSTTSLTYLAIRLVKRFLDQHHPHGHHRLVHTFEREVADQNRHPEYLLAWRYYLRDIQALNTRHLYPLFDRRRMEIYIPRILSASEHYRSWIENVYLDTLGPKPTDCNSELPHGHIWCLLRATWDLMVTVFKRIAEIQLWPECDDTWIGQRVYPQVRAAASDMLPVLLYPFQLVFTEGAVMLRRLQEECERVRHADPAKALDIEKIHTIEHMQVSLESMIGLMYDSPIDTPSDKVQVVKPILAGLRTIKDHLHVTVPQCLAAIHELKRRRRWTCKGYPRNPSSQCPQQIKIGSSGSCTSCGAIACQSVEVLTEILSLFQDPWMALERYCRGHMKNSEAPKPQVVKAEEQPQWSCTDMLPSCIL